MKILYLECAMGATEDMLAAALAELLPDPDTFFEKFNACMPEGVVIEAEQSIKCGMRGTRVSVLIRGHEEDEEQGNLDHDHQYRDMAYIAHIVDHMSFSAKVKSDILAVYRRIVEAESAARGIPITEIQFHEVGALDVITDIAAVCVLMEALDPDEVVVSPIHVGSGQVRYVHGVLPVPTPVTTLLLQDAPIYGGSIYGELCTPIGAALLTHFAHHFSNMPSMTVCAVGCGMGKENYEAANCLRAFWGEREDRADEVFELSYYLDDMTSEQIEFISETLFSAGALNVYTTSIGMKGSKTGIKLSVFCYSKDKDGLSSELFKHTTALDIHGEKSYFYMNGHGGEEMINSSDSFWRKISFGLIGKRKKLAYDDISMDAFF